MVVGSLFESNSLKIKFEINVILRSSQIRDRGCNVRSLIYEKPVFRWEDDPRNDDTSVSHSKAQIAGVPVL